MQHVAFETEQQFKDWAAQICSGYAELAGVLWSRNIRTTEELTETKEHLLLKLGVEHHLHARHIIAYAGKGHPGWW